MGRLEKLKAKIEEVEHVKPVIDLSSGDDEANEDLSLKIVEKALLMRAAKLAQNENDGMCWVDDNVFESDVSFVGVCDSGGDGGNGDVVVENAIPLALDAESRLKEPNAVKKRKKKKKIIKTESEDQSDVITKKEDEAGRERKTENDKGDQAAVELYKNIESNAAQISDNIVLRKLLRGPRYFDPPDSGWSTCYNCGKEGHMAVNCPSIQKKKKPCFLCGSFEHGFKQCSKERLCIICKSIGHRTKKCPEKHKGGPHSSKVCLKCGDYGHDMFSCKNSYSLDDLKEIQCYMCKSFGHLCCVNSVDNSPREVSCYKCGELGHNGMECSSLREEATTTASPNTCYKCGEEGHFARECMSSMKVGKSNKEHSTPSWRPHRENKEVTALKSAPQDFAKSRKRRKTKSEERGLTTPKKPKQRGGWFMEDPEDISQSSRRKTHWMSPSTPSYKGHMSSTFVSGGNTSGSQSFKRMHKYHSGTSNSQSYKKMQASEWGTLAFQGSATPFENRFSASRFSNPGKAGFRGNYDWW